MHLAIKTNFAQDRCAKSFQAAAKVFEIQTADFANQTVCKVGGNFAQEKTVLPVLPPARHDVFVLAQQMRNQHGNVAWVVLQVAIHGHDEVAPSAIDACLHGGGLAEITLQA